MQHHHHPAILAWAAIIVQIFLQSTVVSSRDIAWQMESTMAEASGLDPLWDDLEEAELDTAEEEGSGQLGTAAAGDSSFYDVRIESMSYPASKEDFFNEDWYDYYDPSYPEEDYDDLQDYANVEIHDTREEVTDSHASDIEIKPRPADGEGFLLETTQIMIMTGSALVSFIIVLLTFFMCRRAMAKKNAKKAASAPYPSAKMEKEPSIVKDYQKVPTSTLEILQHETAIRNQLKLNPTLEPLMRN